MRTNCFNRSVFSIAAPKTAARIAGPLPAEKTPLRLGGTPTQSFSVARTVASPAPAGKPSSHNRNPLANCFENRDVIAGGNQRLHHDARVLGVVGNHATTRQQARSNIRPEHPPGTAA